METLLRTRLLESKYKKPPFKAIEDQRLEFVRVIVQFLQAIGPVRPALELKFELKSEKIALARLNIEPCPVEKAFEQLLSTDIILALAEFG